MTDVLIIDWYRQCYLDSIFVASMSKHCVHSESFALFVSFPVCPVGFYSVLSSWSPQDLQPRNSWEIGMDYYLLV